MIIPRSLKMPKDCPHYHRRVINTDKEESKNRAAMLPDSLSVIDFLKIDNGAAVWNCCYPIGPIDINPV